MKKVVIVGSGTAGLIAGIYLRELFPKYDIQIISSSSIGIIGVGEGSTEHWKWFQDICHINVLDLIREAEATHKYGIRFEGWTNHTPDYFHSVSNEGMLHKGTFFASYAFALANGFPLTEAFGSRGLKLDSIENTEFVHNNPNQFHFNTFKLNDFFKNICIERNVPVTDGEVISVFKDPENGFITSINLKDGKNISGDFFIDASGFRRILMNQMEGNEFVSYSEFLPCDSTIAFPTPSDPSGRIRPYTRARAMKSGWMFEIPTQSRRGNGYVYSSRHCSTDEAIREASEVHGFEVEPAKIINFRAGYYKQSWQKNCVAVGLASAFVEPLEATSIGSTIQQLKLLGSYLPTFGTHTKRSQIEYHRIMDSIMENIVSMISLHYVSDRTDSPMWRDQQSAKRPELLNNLLDIWGERPPEHHDVPTTGFELFTQNHFWHVAQGQGVLSQNTAKAQLEHYQANQPLEGFYALLRARLDSSPLIDHAFALKNK